MHLSTTHKIDSGTLRNMIPLDSTVRFQKAYTSVCFQLIFVDTSQIDTIDEVFSRSGFLECERDANDAVDLVTRSLKSQQVNLNRICLRVPIQLDGGEADTHRE